MRKQIIAVLDGGIVQSVEGLPEGYSFIVRDYDVDGMEADHKRDEHDIPYWEYEA